MSRQLKSDIKKYLEPWAKRIENEATPRSRKKTGRLQNSLFGEVKASTSLRFTENWYGQTLTEITNPNPFVEKLDALRIVAEENTEEIVKGITEIVTKYLKSL